MINSKEKQIANIELKCGDKVVVTENFCARVCSFGDSEPSGFIDAGAELLVEEAYDDGWKGQVEFVIAGDPDSFAIYRVARDEFDRCTKTA